MRRKTKALFILTFILALLVGSVFYIVMVPGKWTDEIVEYVNQSHLLRNGWELSVSDLDGQLISNIKIENVYLRKKDSSIVLFCERSVLNLDFTQILSGKWALSNLLMDNLLITLNQDDDSKNYKTNFIEELAESGLRVKYFSINQSSIRVHQQLKEQLYSFDASGKINSNDENLDISLSSAKFHDFQSDLDLNIKEGKLSFDQTNISAKGIIGTLNGYDVTIDGTGGIKEDKNLSLQIAVNEVHLNDFGIGRISEIVNTSKVNIGINIKSDSNSNYFEGSLIDGETSKLISDLKSIFHINDEGIQFSDAMINFGGAQFSGNGRFQKQSHILLHLNVSNLNLENFGLSVHSTNIKGLTSFNIELDKFNQINAITSNIDLKNDDYPNPEFLGASGKIDYRKGILSIQDSLIINLGLGKLQAFGGINLEQNKTDLNFVIKNTDLGFVSTLAGLKESPKGLAYGTIKFSGFLDNPSVKGNLTFNKISYGEINLSSFKSSFIINSIQETRHGSLSAETGNSMFGDINIDDSSLNLYFMGDTILIANASASSDKQYIRLSGKILGFNTIQIDQIQSTLNDQFISNLEPFSIYHYQGRTKFGPAFLKINEGSLETNLELQNGLLDNGHFQMVNVDLKGIGELVGKTLPVSGSAFADFTAMTINDVFSFEGSLQIRDGIWEEMKFDDLLFTSSIKGNDITIKEMQLRKGEDLVLDISGFYEALTETGNFIYPNPNGKIGFSSSLKNFDLTLLSPYLPNWWKLKGNATGSFAMGGTASASEVNFSLNIDEAEFSRLKAQKVKMNGRYSDHRVYFEDLITLTRTGIYRGEGYLPIDFDLIKHDEDRWIESEPVSMNFNSQSSSMEFLSPYFTYIDSITGDIDISLNIQGTPKKPIRNGEIEINNGNIFYTLLDIPISGLNGRALLKDNKLIIEKLTATSNIPKDTNWGQTLRSNIARVSGGKIVLEKKVKKKDNLHIKGSMDMTTFFQPNLAFLINGENIYIRTLLAEIEGVGDIDLSITGKDTINIAGDIIPDEAVLRMEFRGGQDYTEIQDGNSTVFNYRLNFPISDKLFVKNSQIDAEVSGNMSIQKNGNEPYQYAGELEVVDGKFYYFSDVFNIQEGNLAFDPTELNPRLNIEATTEISGEEILVSLTGELNDPVLVLRHSNNFFSQEDLLQLLTLQKRFDDNTADNIGRQSAFLFGKLLENELEKNLARSNPLFDQIDIEGSTAFIDPLGEENVAVKVGTRLTSNLSLSYKRSFSLANPDQVGVEYRLNRNVSLVVTYDDDGQVHLKYRRKYRF